MLRFRWQAIGLAWLLALAGWVVVWMMPNRYESSAKVYIDTDSVLKPLLDGLAVGTDPMSEVSMMATVLMSRPNLERIARETDLNLRAKTPLEFEGLVAGLPKRIRVIAGRDKTYAISYADQDPKVAQRVVQKLLTTFVEDARGDKVADNSRAQEFLTEQLRAYERRLQQAEERLAEFKKKNVGLMPGEEGDYYTRLQADLTNLESLRGRQRQLLERRNELARQLEGEEPGFGLGSAGGGAAGPNDAKIARLRTELDGLLGKYTEKHPEVVSLRETIARLEQENRDSSARALARTMEEEPGLTPAPMQRLAVNPVYQTMRIALSQTEAELAELRGQISTIAVRVGSLRGRVDLIPEVEAELSRLNRDYEVNRAQYSALLQRLESARITEQAAESTDKVKIRVIEPPVVPSDPSYPPRRLLMLAVFIISAGAALALAFGMHIVRPVFGSKRSVATELPGIRVLGTIGKLSGTTKAAWYARPVLPVALAAMLLIAALGGNIVFA